MRRHATWTQRGRGLGLSLLLTSLLPLRPAFAQVPQLIRYQGQAVDSQGVPLEGPYTLTFRLYDAATAGTLLWQEPQNNVTLSKGHFSVLLGQVTPLTAMDWSKSCWLSIQVGAQPELSPRQQLTSVPLAIRAQTAEQVVDISARLRHSASQSLAHDTDTPLLFDVEEFDTAGLHSTVTNTSRLVAPTAGKYFLWCVVQFVYNGTGWRRIYFRLNGADNIGSCSVPAINGEVTSISHGTHYRLGAGDYVEVVAKQTSGGALDVMMSGVSTPLCGMVKLQ